MRIYSFHSYPVYQEFKKIAVDFDHIDALFQSFVATTLEREYYITPGFVTPYHMTLYRYDLGELRSRLLETIDWLFIRSVFSPEDVVFIVANEYHILLSNRYFRKAPRAIRKVNVCEPLCLSTTSKTEKTMNTASNMGLMANPRIHR